MADEIVQVSDPREHRGGPSLRAGRIYASVQAVENNTRDLPRLTEPGDQVGCGLLAVAGECFVKRADFTSAVAPFAAPFLGALNVRKLNHPASV